MVLSRYLVLGLGSVDLQGSNEYRRMAFGHLVEASVLLRLQGSMSCPVFGGKHGFGGAVQVETYQLHNNDGFNRVPTPQPSFGCGGPQPSGLASTCRRDQKHEASSG